MKITLFLFAVVGTACAACGPSSKFDDMTGAPCKAGDVGADVQGDKAVRHHHPKKTFVESTAANTTTKKSGDGVHLAMASLLRNEGPYIIEWLEFHLRMGFERFYIAENGSTDDSLARLEPYVLRGVVTLVEQRIGRRDGSPKGTQVLTNNKMLDRARKDGVRWLGFMDIDEFVYPRDDGETLLGILSRYDATVGAVGISMLNFDHNGLVHKSDAPVIERFTHRRRHDDPFKGTRGAAFSRSKSIVRVESCPDMEIHNPGWLRPGKVFVDVDGRPISKTRQKGERAKVHKYGYTPYIHGKAIVAPHDGPIRLNHYYCKSRQEFDEKNQRNGLWDSKASTWDDRCVAPWNDGVNDRFILQWCPHQVSLA